MRDSTHQSAAAGGLPKATSETLFKLWPPLAGSLAIHPPHVAHESLALLPEALLEPAVHNRVEYARHREDAPN